MMKTFGTRVAKVISRPLPLYITTIIVGTLLGSGITAALMAADHDNGHWIIEFGVGKGIFVAFLGWVITFYIAQWIYYQFQRKQVQISRFTAVSKLEILESMQTNSIGHELELRFVLDDAPWVLRTETPSKMVGGVAQVSWTPILGQRFWIIREGTYNDREYTDLVSSKACHEVLSWFRNANIYLTKTG
jgi:hypothetical protein